MAASKVIIKNGKIVPYATAAAIVPGAFAKKIVIMLMIGVGGPAAGTVFVHAIAKSNAMANAELEDAKKARQPSPPQKPDTAPMPEVYDLEGHLRAAILNSNAAIHNKDSNLAAIQYGENEALLVKTRKLAETTLPDDPKNPKVHQIAAAKLSRELKMIDEIKALNPVLASL